MYTQDGQEAANEHNTLHRQKTSKALDSVEVLNPPPFDEPHSGPTLFFCPKTQIKSIVAHKASWQVITPGQEICLYNFLYGKDVCWPVHLLTD